MGKAKGLGSWIAKGIAKKSARKPRKKSFSSNVRRKRRKSLFAQVASTQTAPPSTKQLIAAPTQPQVQNPIRVEDSESFDGLSTQDFIRPGETLRKSLESFILDQRSVHTKKAYLRDMRRFVKFLVVRRERYGVEALDRRIFIAYKDWLLSEGLQHTTIDRHLATLKGLFRWISEDGMISKNPAESVRFLNPKKLSKTVGFTDQEVRRILNLPNRHTRSGAQHLAILHLLFYCGLRRSELCNLRTSHLGVERDTPVIRLMGKGNVERIIPLRKEVWVAINHFLLICHKDISVDQYLFTPIRNNRTSNFSKPLDSSAIYYIVKNYAKKAGVANKVSPHSCRATAISNARDHQVSDRAIQEFAGWASTDMITRYDKRKTAVKDSAAFSIDYASSTDGSVKR